MTCPNDDVLLGFVERRAVDPLAVERHVDACAPCRKMVAHLAELRAREGDLRGASATRQSEISASSTTSPPTMLSNVPALGGASRIDRYVVERELGRGGMGVVFLALDPSLHRRIAVKVVRPDDSGPTARARLLREARAMASLSHPNVVGIYDVGELPDGQVFLAMELVEGTTLRGALAAPDRNLARTLQLFLQAGRGLEAAHAVGLVHRDFKPDNVLVGSDGRVRVADFGLVRDAGRPHAADAEQPPLTQSGMVVGTPRYMAPEQCLGAPIDARVDQYAYCVALFEALAGASPFAGGSFEESLARKIRDERHPWPSSAPVTPELRSAVERGLAASPEQRHASMAALLAIVERAASAPYVSSPTIDAPLEMPATALLPAPMPIAPMPIAPMPMPIAPAPAPAWAAPIPTRPQLARMQASVPRERTLLIAVLVAVGAIALFVLIGLVTYVVQTGLGLGGQRP